jgi:hypothetical protein
MPGEIDRVAERLTRVAALRDRREVENGEGDHGVKPRLCRWLVERVALPAKLADASLIGRTMR